jgi:hypothetical protein
MISAHYLIITEGRPLALLHDSIFFSITKTIQHFFFLTQTRNKSTGMTFLIEQSLQFC